jgi:SAM-dependent methyltransferase
VFPDPYIAYEDDYKKGQFLAEHYGEVDFRGLVQLYWKITPIVETRRAQRFMRHVFALVDRGCQHLKDVEEACRERRREGIKSVLEVGCGTGGFLVAARRRYGHVVGTDIAFRWLIIARKRLEEEGLRVPLVCACAEHLPFREGSFDLVTAEAVLEHVRDQEAMVRECYRVSCESGAMFAVTANRYSVTAEPHVGVWGVGFLPRKWMKFYVKLVKGLSYDHIRVLSVGELRSLLRKCGLQDHRILLPSIPTKEQDHFSAIQKLQVSTFRLFKQIPVIRSLLYLFVPLFIVIAFPHKSLRQQD